MFKKKDKSVAKKEKAKSAKSQTGKTAAKSVKTQSVKKPAGAGAQTQNQSDKVLAKLKAIEKDTRLKEVRDNVDQLEDEKIAEHIELLLKIMRSGE